MRISLSAAGLVLAATVLSSFFIPWERNLLETVQPLGDTLPGEYFVQAAKYAGNGFYQAIICIIFFFAAKQRGAVKLFTSMKSGLFAITVSGIVANILKFAVGKARPGEKLPNWHIEPFSAANDFHSFPSGHTATSFALAYVLSAYYPRLSVPFFAAAMLVAAGRVIGESHFPSDVLGGALFGAACGWIVTKWSKHQYDAPQQPGGHDS